MGAQLVFQFKEMLTTERGIMVAIYMDLFKIAAPYDPCFPEGYKFSWIAFEVENPENRVLFDCHTPKGPHLHVDGDEEGAAYKWESLQAARLFFFSKVTEQFGNHPLLRREL